MVAWSSAGLPRSALLMSSLPWLAVAVLDAVTVALAVIVVLAMVVAGIAVARIGSVATGRAAIVDAWRSWSPRAARSTAQFVRSNRFNERFLAFWRWK